MNSNSFINSVIYGDSVQKLNELPDDFVNLVYLDPPFFSQKTHSLISSSENRKYEFDDKFSSKEEYLSLIGNVLAESKRILKNDGSIFLHCDRYASHYLREELDKIFGEKNFQSEIIWIYKRWSNSKKGLLNAHQNIYFYSKTDNFKFNRFYTNYSLSTNVDQILQERMRNENGKSEYKKDSSGQIVQAKDKKGVPLSDVWEIPYLNPKAKERCGYPTQKPVKLLQRIIELVTDQNDIVVDPFCGSGTTCVAAKSLDRKFIGIDGFIKNNGELIPVKIQKENETIDDAIKSMEYAVRNKNFPIKILVQTNEKQNNMLFKKETDVKVVKFLNLQIQNILQIS